MDYRQKTIKNLSDDQAERAELLRRRLVNPDEKKMFRNAYCFKAGYDYSTLKPYCENIVMVTDGHSDHIDVTRAKIELGLMEYDSDKDVIVIAGRPVDALLAGQIISPKIREKKPVHQTYAIAMYYNYAYIFYSIPLDSTLEATEMLTK